MKKKSIWLVSLIAILIVALLLWAITREGSASDVKIGCVLSLSGTIAPYGESARKGVEIAASEINAKGGIGGRRLTVVFEDDRSEVTPAVSAVRKLIFQDKTPAIVGFIGSSLLLAAAPIIEETSTILISPGASSPQIRDAGEFIFRTRASGHLEAVTLAKYAVERLGHKHLAVLYVNNDYGLSWLDSFGSQTLLSGGKIVAKEAFGQGANDVRTQLSKVKSANPTCLLILGYFDEIIVAVRQATELGLTVQLLTTIGIQDKKVFDLLGKAAEGIYFSAVDYDPANNPQSKAFDEAYVARFGEPSNIFAADAYDATLLIADAFSTVGTDGDRVRQYLLSMKGFKGAGGTRSFDEKGDVVKPVTMKRIENGQFVTVK